MSRIEGHQHCTALLSSRTESDVQLLHALLVKLCGHNYTRAIWIFGSHLRMHLPHGPSSPYHQRFAAWQKLCASVLLVSFGDRFCLGSGVNMAVIVDPANVNGYITPEGRFSQERHHRTHRHDLHSLLHHLRRRCSEEDDIVKALAAGVSLAQLLQALT